MSKYTPGPWTYQEKSDAYTHIVRGPNNYFITQLAQDTSGLAEANARLIAAAPEILAALKTLLALEEESAGLTVEVVRDKPAFHRFMDGNDLRIKQACAAAHAAIAKAGGRA